MKTLLLALLVPSVFTAAAQTPHERVEVVTVDSTSADELYLRSKKWFVDAFKDSKEVIQLQDEASRTTIGKGAFKFKATIFRGSNDRQGYYHFSIEVACKENRYRVRMYDFQHKGPNIWGMGLLYDGDTCSTKWFNDKGKEQEPKHRLRVCNEEVWPQVTLNEELVLSSLRLAMTSKTSAPATSTKSDW